MSKITTKDLVQTTGKSTLTRLRNAAHPPGKRGLWLKDLSDKHLAEIYHRLLRGQPVNRLATIAQKEWGMLVNSKLEVLCRGIRVFRGRIIGSLVAKATDTVKKQIIKKDLFERASKIATQVDGMELLAWTISEEAERLSMWRRLEDVENSPISATEDTISELGKLLEKYINLQIKLGVLDSKPSEFNLNLKHTFDGIMRNTIKNNEISMVNAANKFAQLAEESAISLEQDKEGMWKMIEDKTEKNVEKKNENNTN